MDDAAITNDEFVAHYVLESGKFKPDGVNHRLFLPSKRTNDKSVFRISGLTVQEITDIGMEHVGGPQSKPILGWAELLAGDVRNLKLTLRRDEPPPRHALIESWPSSPEDQRILALSLAEKAIARRLQR
jgi:hypothetical protein